MVVTGRSVGICSWYSWLGGRRRCRTRRRRKDESDEKRFGIFKYTGHRRCVHELEGLLSRLQPHDINVSRGFARFTYHLLQVVVFILLVARVKIAHDINLEFGSMVAMKVCVQMEQTYEGVQRHRGGSSGRIERGQSCHDEW